MEILEGDKAYQTAQRRARYGHKDWLCWKGRDGGFRAALLSGASIKLAMLAMGTQGNCRLIGASNGHSHIVNWQMAVIIWRNHTIPMRWV